MPRSKSAATRALEIDPRLVSVHVSLAMARLFHDWDWPGTEEELRPALAPDAGDVDALSTYANYLWAMGRFEDAIRVLARAQNLDPLSLILGAATGADEKALPRERSIALVQFHAPPRGKRPSWRRIIAAPRPDFGIEEAWEVRTYE